MPKTVLCVTLLVTIASAQGVDVRDLMKRVDAAVRRVESVSLDAVVDYPGQEAATIAVHVRTRRNRSNPPPFSGDIRLDLPGIEALLSATRLVMTDASRKRVVTSERGTETHDLFVGHMFDCWVQFVHPTTFLEECNAPRLELGGQESIEGVECHRVSVRYESGVEAIWWFARSDLLPRRVVRLGEVQRRTTFSNVKPNVDLAADTFSLRHPGYVHIYLPGPASLATAASLLALAYTKCEQVPGKVRELSRDDADMVCSQLELVQKWLEGAVAAAAKDNQAWRERAAALGVNAGVPSHVTQQVMDNAPGSDSSNFLLFVFDLRRLIANVHSGRPPYEQTLVLGTVAQARQALLQQLKLARARGDGSFVDYLVKMIDELDPVLCGGIEKTFKNIAVLARSQR